MPDQDTSLDNELADLTDSMIAGRQAQVSSTEFQGLEPTVNTLFNLQNASPDPAFRARLTARLNREWDLLHSQRAPSRSFSSRSIFNFIALAALVVIVIGALIFLPQGQGTGVQGFSSGSSEWLPILIIGGLAIAIAAFVISRRK